MPIDARKIVLSPDTTEATPTGAAISALRLGMRTLSAVSPSLAARAAQRLWLTPPRPRIRPEVQQLLRTGDRHTYHIEGRPIAAWRWGNGPAVILMHGWGGFGGQMTAFVEPLVRAGYQAIIFDAPAHGVSGPSVLGPRQTTLFEFCHALDTVAEAQREIAGVVAHSGGATAAAWTARLGPRWKVPSMIFISPMGRPTRYIGNFQRALGLSDEATRRFRDNMEKQFGFRWSDLEVPAMAREFQPPPVLLVHDREDRETSHDESEEIANAWPSAELMSTQGLGHRRILRDGAVIERAIDFIRRRRR